MTNAAEDHDDEFHPAPPPAAPRELTAAARRGAWHEKHVRVWWVCGLVLLGITLYYLFSRFYLWNIERRLITHGVGLQAEVMAWERGGEAPKNKVLPADANVDLAYTYQGKDYRVFGALAGRRDQIYTRQKVPIFIDPTDPNRWTGRTEPGNLAHEMLGAMLLSPGVVVLFLVAMWRRRGVLRTYREGESVLAEVVKVGHSAGAPASRLVSCAVHTETDARVVKTLLPAGKSPAVGQGLWLILPPGRPQDAIPATLFE